MPMRLSGLMSGLDTESVIQQLVAVRQTKVDDAKRAQTKLQWKQDAWKTLNSKILKLYNGILGTSMRFQSSYMKKVTKVSNSSVVSVITGDGAMNSVQSLKVKKLAQAGYLTGAAITGKDGEKITSDTKLSEIDGLAEVGDGKLTVTVGGEEKVIEVNGSTTVSQFVQQLRDAGLNASFDTTNQRFYLASKETGEANDFSIRAENSDGMKMLRNLGLSYSDTKTNAYYEGLKSQYEGIIRDRDNTIETRTAAAIEARLSFLTETKGALESERQQLVEDLREKYGEEWTDIDWDNWQDPDVMDEIRDRVAAKLDEDPDNEELAGWAENWDANAESLEDINGRFDADGVNLSEDEKSSVKDEVTAQVDAEVEEAQSILNELDELSNIAADKKATKNAASDAEIELNGVKYTGSKNTFEINGLTLTVNATTSGDETVTLTTQDDTDGIYDMIKSFIKEYSELINEMDKLYNADSARGYEPLTSEEKDAMSESEIEEWESKIKDSLLRRDSTLSTVSGALKEIMLSGVSVNGKTMYLSDFGINTLSYFIAADNEKNAYHIDGDPDDPNTAANADKLRAMIAGDPQTVIDFFVGLSRNMYSELTNRMARTEYSSGYTVYEDIRMQKEYDDYTSKVKDLEAKLADYEDKWYQKFAKMETALAKLQSNASAVTSLLGG